MPLSSPHDDAPLPGLDGHEGLPEVEALMMRLSIGTRFTRLGVMAQEHLQAPGRRIRARLALAGAEALGVERPRAYGWAAACELLHNATLVHDDIQDGDHTRRDQPTLWVRHGQGQAINAGDLLLMLPFVALADVGTVDSTRWRLSHALARAAERTVRGQSAEMDLASSGRITWDDWAWAAEGKTGALLALPVEGAALLGGLDETTAARLAAPFGAIGLVYQMQDDLLDLTLEKGKGRRAADVREGRVTSLVATHCALHPGEAEDLLETLRTPSLRAREDVVTDIVTRFTHGGAVDALRGRIRRTAQAIAENTTLRAVPDLHAVATDLLGRFVDRSLFSLPTAAPEATNLREVTA